MVRSRFYTRTVGALLFCGTLPMGVAFAQDAPTEPVEIASLEASQAEVQALAALVNSALNALEAGVDDEAIAASVNSVLDASEATDAVKIAALNVVIDNLSPSSPESYRTVLLSILNELLGEDATGGVGGTLTVNPPPDGNTLESLSDY